MSEHYWKELCNDCVEGNEVLAQDVVAVRWAEARIKELERQRAEAIEARDKCRDLMEQWREVGERTTVTDEMLRKAKRYWETHSMAIMTVDVFIDGMLTAALEAGDGNG